MKRNASIVVAAVIVLGLGISWAQDDGGPMSNLRFVVVRDSDGKPVRNAEVVLGGGTVANFGGTNGGRIMSIIRPTLRA